MCGLVASISKSSFGFLKKDLDMFTQLLYADMLRGVDGTGIFYNAKQKMPIIKSLRAPIPSCDFIKTKEYEDAMATSLKEANFIVGHNRAATKGKLTAACTHPFRENHIILVHNGTLVSHKELDNKAEVDSQAICIHLAHNGVKETLSKINGAFALIWFNTKDNTLNFCRNHQRPLYIIETKNTYMLCSELELGKWICARNGEVIIKHQDVIPKTLYTIDIKDATLIKEEAVKYREIPVYNHYSEDFDYFPSNRIKNKQNTNHYYVVGDYVKVKASIIIESSAAPYLSAYILKDKNTPIEQRDDDKYEVLSRVRIYGTKEHLRELLKKKHLVGKVSSTEWKYGEAHLTLSTVEEETNVIALPPPPMKEEEKPISTCEFCDTPFDKTRNRKRYLIDGFVLCKECSDVLYESYLSTAQNSGC